MLRSKVFKKVGNFNNTLSGPEDFEFWCRSALKGVGIAYTTRLLIERHKDEESLTSKSILFLPQYLKALDICESTAVEVGRSDLFLNFNRARGQTWRSMIHAYTLKGDRGQAWNAFLQSLRYGIKSEAFVLITAAMAGPRAIGIIKKLYH
jgi:hypothetical protein